MINTRKLNQEHLSGQMTPIRKDEDLPTIFPMQYRNGRLVFVAAALSRKGKKIISTADHLVELLGGCRIEQIGRAGETT
jgi:hypothetical protein